MTQVTKSAPKVGGANEGRDDGINMVAKKGTCIRCGRALSDPVSIRRGLGPVCYKKFNSETERPNRLDVEDQLRLESPKREPQRGSGIKKLFVISCKAKEVGEKLRENSDLIEALLKGYQKTVA